MSRSASISARIHLGIFIAAGLLSAADPKNNKSAFISDAQFTITSKTSENGRILVDYRLKNKSTRPMLTFDPACLFRYSFPIVRDADGREMPKVETLTTACAHRIICIGPRKVLKGTFGIDLGRMVSLEEETTYTVAFSFEFNPSKVERKTLEKIVRKGELAPNGHFFIGSLRSNELKIRTPD